MEILFSIVALIAAAGVPIYILWQVARYRDATHHRLQREKEHEREMLAMRADHAERMMALRRQAQREGLLHPDDRELDDALR